MPEYLFKALDKQRNEVAERFTADTLVHAESALKQLGYSEIRFYTDDLIAVIEGLWNNPVKPPAKDAIANMTAKTPGVAGAICLGVKQGGMTVPIMAAVFSWSMVAGHRVWAAVIATTLVLLLGFFVWATRVSRIYTGLNKAKVWHRWERVLSAAVKLSRIKAAGKPLIPTPLAAQMRAEALAGLGRMSEALDVFRAVEDHPQIPRWYSRSMLAVIHSIGGDKERALQLSKEASDLKPDCSTLLLDFASRTAWNRKDGKLAGAILEEATALPMHELCRPTVSMTRGIIGLLNLEPANAVDHLRRALTEFDVWRANPLIEGSVYRTQSYLCIAQGRVGNLAEARRLYSKVEKYLRAVGENELLEDCRAAIPQKQRPS